MLKNVSEKILGKDTKPTKPATKEVPDAARKKLMEIKEC
jgi:hypothetical protein